MENIEHVFAAIGGLITCCSFIVKITPSQKDDAILAKVVKVFDQLSIFNPNGKKVVNDK